jgi:hypothetical protein
LAGLFLRNIGDLWELAEGEDHVAPACELRWGAIADQVFRLGFDQ